MTIHHSYNHETRRIDLCINNPSSDMMQNLRHVGEYNMWVETEFPYSVYVGFGIFDEDIIEEMRLWIIENLVGKWVAHDPPFLKYHFENASDAVAFKLRWF